MARPASTAPSESDEMTNESDRPFSAGAMRAGIRDTGSGTKTVIHVPLKRVMTMLAQRAARRRGLLADNRLEAIAIDSRRQIFAGFWP
jgi:hypothetical protein